MGLSIGHRGGVKPRRRGNGLSKIKRRHGIPFYNPAETYEKHDFLLADAVKIFFTAKGSIHNGTPTVKGVLKGASSIIFDPKGELSRVTAPSAESQRMQGKTTIHFFQSATISKHHKMQGVSWIVFALKMLVHRIKGESDIVFSTSATLHGYKLRGIASITFSAIINNVRLVKYGLLYNWYAATDARNIFADGWGLPTGEELVDLVLYLGDNPNRSHKVREVGIVYWNDPNTGATNEVGFNGRGAGYRAIGGFGGLKSSLHLFHYSFGGTSCNISSISVSQFLHSQGLIDPSDAASIRPIKNSTTLSPGQTGTYTGNDGQTYPTIAIETAGTYGGKVVQEWLACNLAETKFRGGLTGIKYGALYNWYAATDVREITAAGWHVLTETEFDTLGAALGGNAIAGGKMKETGLTYWLNPNTGATNETGFNGRGSAYRQYDDGTFKMLNSVGYFWSATEFNAANARFRYLLSTNTVLEGNAQGADKKHGFGLRIAKDTTALSDGEVGTYAGNDGRIYRSICISGVEYLSENLCETKFRDGSTIPNVTDNATWAASTGSIMCYYDNDWNNAYGGIIEGSDDIPEVTDAGDWAALTTAGMCAYNNDWTNVFI